jgi:hypothetical protein
MSRLLRGGTADYRRGGLLSWALNQPWVLVLLLGLCVGLIVWGFRRANPGADALFTAGAALMAQDDPAAWERAWSEYLDPLERRYPDHAYQEQLEAFRSRGKERLAQKRALAAARAAGPSEARRFYQQGLKLCQEGNIPEARRVWQDLVITFDGIDAEQRWVSLAERGLKELPAADDRWDWVRETLQRARKLPRAEAEKIWKAIEDLYRDDPSARPVLEEVQRDRAGKR